MIMNQPSCFERLHKLQQFWPSASTTARSLTCKRKTCTVASWLFQLPWLNSLTDEREETLTKANSHNPHRLSILGKMQAALTPPPHHHPGHSAAELRMWSTIKKNLKKPFSFQWCLCVFGYQKNTTHQSECGRVFFRLSYVLKYKCMVMIIVFERVEIIK